MLSAWDSVEPFSPSAGTVAVIETQGSWGKRGKGRDGVGALEITGTEGVPCGFLQPFSIWPPHYRAHCFVAYGVRNVSGGRGLLSVTLQE